MNTLNGLTLPLKYQGGVIVDGAGKTIMEAERNSLITPLNSTGRDAILQLACELINRAMQHDEADKILKSLGY